MVFEDFATQANKSLHHWVLAPIHLYLVRIMSLPRKPVEGLGDRRNGPNARKTAILTRKFPETVVDDVLHAATLFEREGLHFFNGIGMENVPARCVSYARIALNN